MRKFAILLWPALLAVFESYCECSGGVDGRGLLYIATPLSDRRPHSTEQRSDYRKWCKKSYDPKWGAEYEKAGQNHDLKDDWSLRDIRKQHFYDNTQLAAAVDQAGRRDLRNFYMTSRNLWRRKRLDLMGVGNMDYAAASFDKASQRSSTEVDRGSSGLRLAIPANVKDSPGNLRQSTAFSGWTTGGVSRFRGGGVASQIAADAGQKSGQGAAKPINIDQMRFMMEKLRMAG